MMGQFLVGDVGGTSTRFGLAHMEAPARAVTNTRKFSNDAFASFDLALTSYLETCQLKPTHALFAIAGPVSDGQVQLTNRDWAISAQALEANMGFDSVALVNDFSAMARAVPELDEDSFSTVLGGQADPAAPILVAGPGTGLGMATLIASGNGSGRKWQVLGGEGGHAAFAPDTNEDMQVAKILRAEHGFVSYELVTSGRGLEPVHRAMCELYGADYRPMTAQNMLAAALDGDVICDRICALRARAIMRFVGDMALANGALGGVALAGGVTTRLLSWLKREEASSAFLERGARSDYMSGIPVRLMQGEFIPLVGAAALFADRAG